MTDKDESEQTQETQAAIPQALLDHVIANYKKPADLIGENGMLKQLTKAVIEAALAAEMNQHLGHTRYGAVANASGNVRNGQSAKTITGDFGAIEIAVPRDRDASFTPQLITKHQRRVPGFDERILSLYARGMSTREIAAHLQEMFGAEVSPALISAITDTVADEVRAWQSRPLDRLYPILYLDCLMVKTRGSFPSDEAAIKLLYLGLRNISQRWTMPIQNWKQAMSQLMIRFEAQFNNA